MKQNNTRIRYAAPLLALALAAGAQAGTETTTTAVAPAKEEDFISGTLKLDLNTHFISYGNDIWGDGGSWHEPTFNPMFELAIQLPAGFTFTLGTWWDVNEEKGDFEAESAIGGRLQEVDVWAGLGYTIGDFTVKATYQQWYYASDTEGIIDIAFSYDTFLSPSITIHNRVDAGAAGTFGGDEGTVIVGGLSYGFDAGPVAISFPLNIAYFVTDGFHPSTDAEDTDEGFGYGSLGVAASYPLAFIPEAYGTYTLNANVTYYMTSDDVIPTNPVDNFFTAGIGLAIAF